MATYFNKQTRNLTPLKLLILLLFVQIFIYSCQILDYEQQKLPFESIEEFCDFRFRLNNLQVKCTEKMLFRNFLLRSLISPYTNDIDKKIISGELIIIEQGISRLKLEINAMLGMNAQCLKRLYSCPEIMPKIRPSLMSRNKWSVLRKTDVSGENQFLKRSSIVCFW